jgi:hypothetical protein
LTLPFWPGTTVAPALTHVNRWNGQVIAAVLD